jgi:hypothetical protein
VLWKFSVAAASFTKLKAATDDIMFGLESWDEESATNSLHNFNKTGMTTQN